MIKLGESFNGKVAQSIRSNLYSLVVIDLPPNYRGIYQLVGGIVYSSYTEIFKPIYYFND